MDFSIIQKLADHPYWDEQETVGIYQYPIHGDFKKLQKDARELAKISPPAELYWAGPFLAAQSRESHIGPYKWAVDFLVRDETEILAMESGTILEIEESSTTWGNGPEFANHLNYITIQHENGEYSQYCHVVARSVSALQLKIGDKVEKGQPIGVVGKCGWTDRDHLHVIVFVIDQNPKNPMPMSEGRRKFKSLKIRYETE